MIRCFALRYEGNVKEMLKEMFLSGFQGAIFINVMHNNLRLD